MERRPFSNWSSTDWAKVSVVLLGVTWLPPMFKSLWVDELGTYWAIDGSFAEMISRVTEAHGQSPFTYGLMWAWNRALEPSDFGLRVLPVLFGVGTLVVLHSIGKKIGGSSMGWYAVVAVGGMYEMRAMVVNFRPYAFALFFFALSTRLLLAWDENPSKRSAVGYVLATAATVWSVFYFGFPLIGHFIYILARRKEGSESSRGFGFMVAGTGILCLPLIPQLVSLGGRADTLQFSGIPMMRAVIGGLIPIGMAGTWLIVVLVSGLPGRWVGRRSELILIGWLAVAPTAMLYLLTVFTDFGLWTVRYRSVFLLGFGLAVAVWIAGYAEERVKVRAVLVVILVGLLVSPPQDFASDQDWRGGLASAASSIGADGLVILGAGLVEASSLASLEDPQASRFIAAPLSRYPVRQSVLLAPLLPAGEAFPYLVERLRGAQYTELAVASLVGDPPGYDTFYLALEPLGFTQVESKVFGRVQVIVYRRS